MRSDCHVTRFVPELTLLDVCMSAKCFSNQSLALKVINDGGVAVNHEKLANPHAVLVFGRHILPNMITVLRVGKRGPRSSIACVTNARVRVLLGKKNFYIIRWTTAMQEHREQGE